MKKITLLLYVLLFSYLAVAQNFAHPGGLHTLEDLNRMKEKVAAGESPWIEGWNQLISDSKSSSSYSPAPRSNMGDSRQRAAQDAQAAYANALRWYISGDIAHAETAVRILNAWSSAVNRVPSGTDQPGLSGIYAFHFAVAAEMVRVYPGWEEADVDQFKGMLKDYLYPIVHDFLTNHRGTCIDHYWANWDICNVGALIAMGVFLDDEAIYNEGIEYFKNGAGNGRVDHAIYYVHPHPDGYSYGLGQWQESGRDMPHTAFGVGMMGELAQVAWNQGDDLFSYGNNRILAGAEYVARSNAALPVPYQAYNNCDNVNQRWITARDIGRLGRPSWELLYNHYVVRKGLSAPNLERMAHLARPEKGSGDHLGFGTLAFTLDATASPYPAYAVPDVPTGVKVTQSMRRVFVDWKMPEDPHMTGFTVKRSTTPGGPYSTVYSVDKNISPSYIDNNLTEGETYYYVVEANNPSGNSGHSAEVSVAIQPETNTLPTGWTTADIGGVTISGSAMHTPVSANSFEVASAGQVGGSSDAISFTHVGVSGNGVITGRLLNDWDNTSRAGIMLRESLDPDSKALFVKRGDVGGRISGCGYRSSTGGNMTYEDGNAYAPRYAWYRIERSGDTFTAYESGDGTEWFVITSVEISMSENYFVGLVTSSGDNSALSRSSFDNVTVVAESTSVPDAPSGLNALSGNTQITLSWNAASAASSYILKRATQSGGPYTTVVSGHSDTTYVDTGLENGTAYYYVVAATNFAGESANAPEISATPELAIAQAPEGVTAQSVSGQQVNLFWNESLSSTSYNVKRSTESGGPYTVIASTDTTVFSDTAVDHFATYYYVISAINELGESENSAEVNATPGRLSYWKFDEGSGVSAEDSWGGNTGTLASGSSWTSGMINNSVRLDGSSNGYVSLGDINMSEVNEITVATWIRFDEDPVAWARIFDLGSGTSLSNTMYLIPNTGVTSDGKNTIRFAIYSDGSTNSKLTYNYDWQPGAWTHIAVTQSGSTAKMYINGEFVAETTFDRGPSNLGIADNNNLGRSQRGAKDPFLKGSIDEFKIYNTALSDEEIASMLDGQLPPASPTILSVSGDKEKVALTWGGLSNASGYNVKRSAVSGGPYTTIESTTETSFNDATLTDDEVYYYVVSAVNENGESANSAEVKSAVSGKIGYWKMDETNGTTAADSWANGDGVLHGDVSWSPGIEDNSVLLDGSGDYVTLPDGLLGTANEVTIATWVRFDENPVAWARLFDIGSGNNLSNSMYLVPNTGTTSDGKYIIRFAIYSNGSTNSKLTYNYAWQPGEWTHIAVTQSGSTAKMFINGTFVAETTFDRSVANLGYTNNNNLGRSQRGTKDPFLKGAIDEFKVYNRALNDEEIAEAMKIKQEITFEPLVSKLAGDAAFAITAEASSGLPVYFTSSDTSVAKVVGDMVYITGVGSTEIIAHQEGDSLYRTAEPVVQSFTVQPIDLKVFHKDGDYGNTANNSIKPHLQIVNDDSIAVAYDEISVRYWFTPENYADINTWIDYAQVGKDNVSMDYVTLAEPHEGAFGYIEYRFDASLGDLMPGAGSGPIQSRFSNSDWSNFSETDDYSFQPNTTYMENGQITLYRNGVLVWGSEPESVTPELNLKVYSENKNANTSTNTINTYLKLVNEGNVPVDYKNLSIKYWFTKDSEADLNYWIDYAKLGGSNISGQFIALDPAVGAADTYFEITVDSLVGTLYPWSSTGDIQYRIAKSNWSKFEETNDYSWLQKAPYTENVHITVYYKDELVYGIEPNNDNLAMRTKSQKKSSVNQYLIDEFKVYPNPVSDKLTVFLNNENQEVQLMLHSSTGKLLLATKVISNEYILDFNTLAKGFYILTITDENGSAFKKVVKE